MSSLKLSGQGLFFEDEVNSLKNKETFLISEGWKEVFDGYWCEIWKLERGDNPREICQSLQKAYLNEKGFNHNTGSRKPEKFWLGDDYLPYLEDAREMKGVEFLTDGELIRMSRMPEKQVLVYDVESYVNYFEVGFMCVKTRKAVYFELDKEENKKLQIDKLKWIYQNFTCVGFNNLHYDRYVLNMAICGKTEKQIKTATSQIIEYDQSGYKVLKNYRIKLLKVDEIDIKPVIPGKFSLKIYGGRLHCKKMQDLPFPPEAALNKDQKQIVAYYNINDLHTTADCYNAVQDRLDLRVKMSDQYGIDLRSKSDAQIAEAIFRKKLPETLDYTPKAPFIPPGTIYKWKAPEFLRFKTPMMRQVFEKVKNINFVLSPSGKIEMPKELKEIKIKINNSEYNLQKGGLHSKEKSRSNKSEDGYILKDVDVTSYYPFIILNNELYPVHLGKQFLILFENIVNERLSAKKSGDKLVAESLKIVINGTYGKLGEMFSVVYAPDLMLSVCLIGQLSLLMLIESLELAGIEVVSGNTDGIVIKCKKEEEVKADSIIKWWESVSGFQMEATYYKALYSIAVNTYIAVKEDNSIKFKGSDLKPSDLHCNPSGDICIEALQNYVLDNIPVAETVSECKDIKKFVLIRKVEGGAIKFYKDGNKEFLGKVVRYYYAKNEMLPIVYATNGNKVPNSDGAKPLMVLPETIPDDLDYDRYIKQTYKLMKRAAII